MSHTYPEGHPETFEDQTPEPECDRCMEKPCKCDAGEKL